MSGRASIQYLGARVFSGVLQVATISLFARGIGPEGYAWLTLVMAGSSLISSVLMQPVNQSLARFLPRAGFSDLLSTLMRLVGMVAPVLLLVALIVEDVRPAWLPAGVALGVWALQMGQGLFDMACQHANTTLHARRYSALFVAKAVLVLLIGMLMLWIHPRAEGMLGAMVGGFALAGVIIGWPTWRDAWRGRWTPTLLRTVAPYALPLMGTLLLNAVLTWTDRILLSALSSAEQTGGYGAASDLVLQGLVLASSAFFLAWYPRMIVAAENRDHTEVDRLANRYALPALALLIPMALGYALVRHNLVIVLLGREYMDVSDAVMPWLALSALLSGVRAYLLDLPLYIGGRMLAQFRNAIVCAVLSVLLNILLIPRYGALGAAYAAVAAQLTGCVLSIIAGRGVLHWRIDWRGLMTVALACALMAVGVSSIDLFGAQGLLVQVLAGVAVYGVVMMIGNVAGCRDFVLTKLQERQRV